MQNKNTIIGKKQPWKFEKKISEGDAGAVYLVRGLHTGEMAILKCPTHNPFIADRQAHQIKLEGEILRKINGIKVALENWNINVRAVNLIDFKSSDDYFVVLECISGFDLKMLSSIWREIKIAQRANPVLEDFFHIKKSFNLILLLSFYGVAQYLKTIHYLGPNQNSGNAGVLWGDLNPEHIFWDFKAQEIILIDWGNSEFLYENREQNQFSEYSDWRAFIDEFQRFYKMFELDDFIVLGFPDALGNPETNERVVEEFLSQLEGGIQELTNEINKLSSEVKTLQSLGLYEQILPYLLNLLCPSISFSPSEQSWIAENLHQYLTDSNFINNFTKLHDRGIPLIQAAETAAVLVDRHYSQSENTIELNLAKPNSFRWIIAFHRMDLLEKYLENTDLEKYPSDIRRKSEEIIYFIREIKHLLDHQDINEERILSTIGKCYEKMSLLHAGTLAFILYGGSFTWTEFIIRWSQEILMNEDEIDVLRKMNLYQDFISKIQSQYTSRVEPLGEMIKVIHIQFGQALLDKKFIYILKICMSGRLSFWDSILISAVMTSNNTSDLTKDQVVLLENMLESDNTLELLNSLGLHNSFTEKLRQLGIFSKHEIFVSNPIPKPIVAISNLESSWIQIRIPKKLRISLICDWNDKASLEKLSRVFGLERFNKLIEARPLYSNQNWTAMTSDICHDADIIVICLSRQFDLETQHLLVKEITKLSSEYGEKHIIPARLDDYAIPSGLNRWHGVDLFEPDDYNRLVRGLVRSYKKDDEPDKEMAAPPPIPPLGAPMPIISRILGMFLTAILIIVSIIICSISLFNIFSTSQTTATPLQPMILSPFWLGSITLTKGVAVAMLFTLIPFWAAKITKYKSRVSQSITEILMFSIVLSVVAFFMFKLEGDGSWMLFAIAIVAVLDGGGHLLDYLRENQIDQIRREISSKQKSLRAKMKSSRKAARLEKEINQYQVTQEYLLRFDQIFQRERILYASLPAGILLGVIFGIYKDVVVYEYLEYSILFVSLFTTLILGYFVAKSFLDMTSPVYAGEYTPDESMPSNSTDLEKFREEKENVLGFAKTTTDIRSMYLYDSAHNIFLLACFAYIFFSSIDNALSLKMIVLIVLLSLALLNQLPFAIGQYLLREGILKKYAGYANAVMRSELKKDEFAPLVIKPEFFTSLFTVGAGGLLITFAENFVKELFK